MSGETTQQVENRNEDGTFKKGFSGNPGGRMKGLKDFDRDRFALMDDKQKAEFLETISPELRYRMAEGNPAQTTEAKVEITLPKPLLDLNVLRNNNSNQKTSETNEEN